MRAGVERQQQQFEMCRLAVFRGRGDAGDRAEQFFGDDGDDFLDFVAAVRRKQRGKALVLQVAAEQGADPAFPRRETDSRSCRHRRARKCRRAIRAPRQARSRSGPVPVRRRAARPNRRRMRDWMDVSFNLPQRLAPVGQFCPAFAHAHLPSSFCRTEGAASHAVGAVRLVRAGLSGVKVKLTMRLARHARWVGYCACARRGLSRAARGRGTQGWLQTVWSPRGEGWGYLLKAPRGENQGPVREGFSPEALPFHRDEFVRLVHLRASNSDDDDNASCRDTACGCNLDVGFFPDVAHPPRDLRK